MIKLIAALMLLASVASADTVIKYGANVPKDGEKLGSTKAIFAADQNIFFGPFVRQYELGGWFDNTSIEGRHSSGLASASLGVHVNTTSLFAQALVGPAFITNTDSNLGGHFQFNNDLAFGLRDTQTEATLGLAYKHVSSAGLASPNKGRDLIMFRVSVPF